MSSFELWWHEVAGSNQLEKAACCLSTTGRDGQPNSRMVLLRGHGPEGFYFFTNYQSEKAREISENCRVGLNFHRHLFTSKPFLKSLPPAQQLVTSVNDLALRREPG